MCEDLIRALDNRGTVFSVRVDGCPVVSCDIDGDIEVLRLGSVKYTTGCFTIHLADYEKAEAVHEAESFIHAYNTGKVNEWFGKPIAGIELKGTNLFIRVAGSKQVYYNLDRVEDCVYFLKAIPKT